MQETPKLDQVMGALVAVGCVNDLAYEVERLKYFRDELQKLSPLQVNDRVRFARTYEIPEFLPNGMRHGWKHNEPTFVEGAMATVVELGHRNGAFSVALRFDLELYYSGFEKQLKESASERRHLFYFAVSDLLEKVKA